MHFEKYDIGRTLWVIEIRLAKGSSEEDKAFKSDAATLIFGATTTVDV
jgi:hypothetical protein